MGRVTAVALVVGLAVGLAHAAPAYADDDVEIDGRLMSEGFDDAFTDYLFAEDDGGEGVRVQLDYASDSSAPAAYDVEAREAAEVIWQNLELRVLAVDVVPTYGVRWLDGGLPQAVSLSRGDLEQAYGPRPSGLDGAGAGFYGGDGDAFVLIGIGVGVLAVLGLLVGVGTGGFFLGRRRGRSSAQAFAAAGWGAGAGPGAGWSAGAGAEWGAGWGAPGAMAPGPVPPPVWAPAGPRPGPSADGPPDPAAPTWAPPAGSEPTPPIDPWRTG